MLIQITIERRCLQLNELLSGLAALASLRSETQQPFLAEMAGSITAYTPLPPLAVDSNTVRVLIQQVSKQMVYRPLDELQHFHFTYAKGAFLLPKYPRLFYMATRQQPLAPSKSAIAAIGEGVAALLSQRLYPGTVRLARLYHTYPDLVSLYGTTTLMTEAMAAVDSVQSLKALTQATLCRMAQYVSAWAALEVRPVLGLLIGTALLDATHYHAVITEVRR